MAEYIEREALFKKALEEKRFVFQMEDLINNEIVVKTVYSDFAEFVNSIPAADVVERNAFNRLMERYKKATGRMPNGVMRQMVEVVRCKDCKHCLQTSMHCVRPTAANKYPKMKADDFCSYGERREVNDAN